MVVYVVFRRNKSVEFTLVFSLRSIFFRFLAGETAFLHTKTRGQLWTPNILLFSEHVRLFFRVGSSRGREGIYLHNPGVNNEWRLPLLPLTPSWPA